MPPKSRLNYIIHELSLHFEAEYSKKDTIYAYKLQEILKIMLDSRVPCFERTEKAFKLLTFTRPFLVLGSFIRYF